MESIFSAVENFLANIASITGLKYEEVNIILYFFILPITFIILIDAVYRNHYVKVGYVLFLILFAWIAEFSQNFFDRAYNLSVKLLNSFGFIGMNYTPASVVICVFLPLFIYIILISILIFRKRKRNGKFTTESHDEITLKGIRK
jgi:hypothetical protein